MIKCDKIIVPEALRRNMLKAIHAGHLGIEKCKLRAIELLFWDVKGQRKSGIKMYHMKCLMYDRNRRLNLKERGP